jgi:hypothetical protein
MKMDENGSQIKVLFEKIEHYVKTGVDLYKLKAIDRSADVISGLTVRLIMITLSILFFLILSIGIALWIGMVLGKTYYGFLIVAGFYALLISILYLFRNKWLKAHLRNSIIMEALK